MTLTHDEALHIAASTWIPKLALDMRLLHTWVALAHNNITRGKVLQLELGYDICGARA